MIDVGKKNLVIIGNGMVGYKFCEKLIDKGGLTQFNVTVFGEEPRPAYDRVQLTSYFSGKTVSDLTLATSEWYEENSIQLYVNDLVATVDRKEKVVVSKSGRRVIYDQLIFATGSYPFVPPLPGNDKKGVFVYRTIEDLDSIMAYAKTCKSAAVLGGGLLGLEAAKALVDLKLKTHVVEYNPRLMPRQIDQTGSDFLQEKIKKMGVRVHLNCDTKEIVGDDSVKGLRFSNSEILDVDMLVISVGIRPRDELAKQSGLTIGSRGGITVNAQLQTSDQDIYAIGECALFNEMTYGLVGPGYKMAEVVAGHLLGESQSFNGADMSTKLKLLGVEVGSFGNPFAGGEDPAEVVVQNFAKGIYKKLLIDRKKNILLGGVLIGDTTEYSHLLQMVQMKIALPDQPESLLIRSVSIKSDASSVQGMSESAGVCSCENVCKGRIVQAFHEGCQSVAKIKKATKAGTVCGSCVPLISEIIDIEMKKAGHVVKKTLCPCFEYTRVELADMIRKEKYQNFWQVIGVYGKGRGCEVCKPTVASILASYQHEYVLEHQNIQDTNDHFLANIQNNGSYSVVPRIAGGEIKPEQLIAIGEVAQEFNLYTKITGGQRIDLFGAKVEQLPLIWAKLRAVGLESGHAYAKALRTVKSCVGSTWCRFGVQDSVGMAIRIENRYKGLRAPHKIKSAVSGCARECAEAQSKDFGVIATEKGYNLFVCGNGGMKPQHAQLLAADLDDDTLIKYIDRFLMFYIRTADRLTRTAPWLNKLEGGLQRLKEIVIDDCLGIADELEKEMQVHVESYKCEWAATLDSPEKLQRFRPFVNSTETDSTIQFVPERGQKRPDVGEILKQRQMSV